MKFIDLFSGIGGFRSALELNGHKCIAYSEVDKFAKQSYQAVYNTEDEIDLGDITKISEEYLSHFKQENDIVVGGSPCQSFSLAGNRKGFEDTRGTLFFEYAKVVKETQPKYFLFENVKGMLSHDKGNTIRVVLETFNQLGYYIDFNVFNSKYYEVPQNRERIYIVGKRKDLVDNPKYQEKVKGKKKLEEVHNWAVDNINYVKLLPKLKTEVTTRLIDVLEDEVDEKYYLHSDKAKQLVRMISDEHVVNNKIVVDASLNEPKIKNVMNTVTSRYNAGIQNYKSIGGVVIEPKIAIKEATKKGYAIAEQGDSVNVSFPNSKTRRGRVGKQVAQTLQAGEVNQGVVVNSKICRRCNGKLEPSDLEDYEYVCFECDENFYEFETKDEVKSIIGSTQKNAYVGDGSISPSLTSAMGQGGGHVPMPVYSNLRIRKLTPLECWRLQGFTDEQFYKAKDSGVSNSQLYKQAGNAVTVNVVDYIVKNIIKEQ